MNQIQPPRELHLDEAAASTCFRRTKFLVSELHAEILEENLLSGKTNYFLLRLIDIGPKVVRIGRQFLVAEIAHFNLLPHAIELRSREDLDEWRIRISHLHTDGLERMTSPLKDGDVVLDNVSKA